MEIESTSFTNVDAYGARVSRSPLQSSDWCKSRKRLGCCALVVLACVVIAALAIHHSEILSTSEDVKSPTAFVYLFEWQWADVAKECEDWLGPKGFTAVQVSPASDHIKGDSWTARYEPVTYDINSRSGSEQEFIDMIRRCKQAGVSVYAEVVFNHVAGGSGTSIGGHTFGPRATPIFNQDDFHHNANNLSDNCVARLWHNKQNTQTCDVKRVSPEHSTNAPVHLPDLCTGCGKVQQTLADYANRLSKLGIDGIYIHWAKFIDTDELDQVLSRVDKRLLRILEVEPASLSNSEAVTADMYTKLGRVTEYSYSRNLEQAFRYWWAPWDLRELENFGAGENWHMIPSDDAVVFLDGPAIQRFSFHVMNYFRPHPLLYQLAGVFMLAHPYGYPRLMSSFDFFTNPWLGPPNAPVHNETGGMNCLSRDQIHFDGTSTVGWVCEHRWPALANMVAWRTSAGKSPIRNFQKGEKKRIAFCRGQVACVAINLRQEEYWNTTLSFTLPAGRYCNVIESDNTTSCPVVEVSADGHGEVRVPPWGAVAIHAGKKQDM